MDKLSLDPDNSQEEPLQLTNTLIPPPTSEKEEETTTQETKNVGTDNKQHEGEECKERQKIYVGQLSDEESDTNSDFLSFSYYH